MLVIAAGASLVWLVNPWFDAVNDAALYILTAKSLAAGDGYTYLGAPFIIRPPGFSVLLAPLVAWRGTDFLALNLYVSAWGVLAVALLFAWIRPRLGTLLAACVAVCVWLNPGWRQMCNQTMSDIPGAALLLACLLLERWARRVPPILEGPSVLPRPSMRRDVVLALSIGLAAYVRSGLLLLAPAVLLQRAIERWRTKGGATPWRRFAGERLLVVAGLPFLVLLPWKIRETFVHPVPPVDQTSLYSYTTGMWHVDRGDPASPRLSPGEVLGRVPVRAREILSTLGTRLRGSDGSVLPIPLGLLGAAALAAALYVLLRENRAEGWFLVGTLALMLVYFDFRERLVLPVYLLVLPAVVEGVLRGLRRFAGERTGLAVSAALVLVLTALDFEPRRGWAEIERVDGLYRNLCRELSVRLPKDARLASPFASWRYSVYLDRPVYTLFFGWTRSGGDMRGAEAVIDKYRIDRVVLSPFSEPDRAMAPYFEERYGIGERVGELSIVRVR